jgi:hypothetical protein
MPGTECPVGVKVKVEEEALVAPNNPEEGR